MTDLFILARSHAASCVGRHWGGRWKRQCHIEIYAYLHGSSMCDTSLSIPVVMRRSLLSSHLIDASSIVEVDDMSSDWLGRLLRYTSVLHRLHGNCKNWLKTPASTACFVALCVGCVRRSIRTWWCFRFREVQEGGDHGLLGYVSVFSQQRPLCV